MEFWQRIEARGRPEQTVPLNINGETVPVRLRALPPAEWDALVEAFPAGGEDAAQPGQVDLAAMRWPLIAQSVVAPDGSPPRDPQWWEDLAKAGVLVAGEVGALTDVAWLLNQPRGLGVDLGKD